MARRSWPAWRRTPVGGAGGACCSAPPQWMRARRRDLAALEVFEAGKPWKEADADVCEAIDFCEYYGREMLRLGQGRRRCSRRRARPTRCSYQRARRRAS